MNLIFNLFAVFYAFRSLQLAGVVYRDWGKIQDQTFTNQQKRLAEQAAFFLAVPVAVFFHELAHALTIWAFGGYVANAFTGEVGTAIPNQIINFLSGYRFFWGFVQPVGRFTVEQNWLIALAGTLGSLIFGLAIWLALRGNQSPTLRYFGLRSFRLQIFFSLIYYPVFTLLGFYGDWRTIYDFDATPVLSGITLALHIGGLGLFVWADRRGWFQMPTFEAAADRERFASLEARAAANPQDEKVQLQLIEAYRQSGLEKQAQQHLKAYLNRNPNSAEAHLQQALLYANNKQEMPARARKSADMALSLGLTRPAGVAIANQVAGQYHLGVGKLDAAIDHFSKGIAAAKKSERTALVAHLHHSRAVAYRRQGQYDLAYEDIRKAIELSRLTHDGQAMSHYQAELATIESHSGRTFGPSP